MPYSSRVFKWNHTPNKGHAFACHSLQGFVGILETKCWQSRWWCSGKSGLPGSFSSWAWRRVELRKRRLSFFCCVTTAKCMEVGETGIQWLMGSEGNFYSLCLRPFRCVCVLFILNLLPLFLLIISLAPGHSYPLFSYYLHWKST